MSLRLESVVKRFGDVTAVAGVSLDVEPGTFLTILGPSGSGKTTLLRMIAGFLPVTDGLIRLAGRDVSRVPPGGRDIGMVFQNYALFPHLSVIENVGYGLKVRGRGRAERARRAREVLALVGLEGYDRRLPRQLSGGQQQRVALARALAFEPTMLLMDEPLGALDRELRVRMAGELRRLHEELGNTVLYVTHDREEALTLSDRIAVLRDGKLEAVGTPQRLYGRPETAFVASFFGGHNCVPCEKVLDAAPPGGDTARVRCLGQVLEVRRSPRLAEDATDACLAIPGDGIELAAAGAPATVHSAVYMGNQIQVLCDVEPGVRIRVDLPGGTAVPPPADTRVHLTIRPDLATALPTG
ncbi:ABC transporter ATP-binding protein [Pseudonocardia acaciae]|uniref:ABC transporter ATP-binding protein n=1 Tax=Pseudonocardia acaciae TaxID=551276 RepID=UPI0006871E45|nr:ABC transporter ATP-binding protein [Pseudonocardia acaciae]